MRILYVNHTAQKSGAGISLLSLISHLPADIEKFFLVPAAPNGDVTFAGRPERTFREPFLCQFMTTVYSPQYPPWLFAWHFAKWPIALLRVWWLVRRWRIDLLHLNETTLIAYAVAALLAGVPVVIHARTVVAQRPFERWLLNCLGRSSRVCMVAIDGEVRESLPKWAQDRSEIIYDPIELGPKPSESEVSVLRATWQCEPDTIIVGQVASLHRQKGIWLVLDLAETLCACFPEVQFVLVGDSSERAGEGPLLRQSIAARNLLTRVILPGYDSRLSLIYGAIDISLCLFAEHLSGVGRAAHEAAIAGKPSVVTLPNPQLTQTTRHGVGAYVFPPNDRKGIELALRSLIAGSKLRREAGVKAQAFIGSRHSPGRIAHQTQNLYSKLMAEK